MKQLNITYEDKDFSDLVLAKSRHGGNWHDLFLDLARWRLTLKFKEDIKRVNENGKH